jgi:hypothetical protein
MRQRGDVRRSARAVGVEEKRTAARRRGRPAVGIAIAGREEAEASKDSGGTEDFVGYLLGLFLQNILSDI